MITIAGECIMGIADFLTLRSAPGDVCVKVDADMLLVNPEWLSGVTDKARSYRQGKAPWCGLWSCGHTHLVKARKWLEIAPMGVMQPESYAFMSAFHATGGIETLGPEFFGVYREGRNQDGKHLVTLSSRREGREARLLALFDNCP